MSDEIRFTTRYVEVYDTGIGREAGFKDDAALIEAAAAERAALDPATRAAMDEIDRRMDDAFLFGSDTA